MDPNGPKSGEPWFVAPDKLGRPNPACTNPDPNTTDPSQCSGAGQGEVIDDTWIVQSRHGPFVRQLRHHF